jgi:hypothetical protein
LIPALLALLAWYFPAMYRLQFAIPTQRLVVAAGQAGKKLMPEKGF